MMKMMMKTTMTNMMMMMMMIKMMIMIMDVIFLSFKKYDLKILSEKITCTTINTRDKRQRIFLNETIKEKTPQLPQR